MIPSSIIGGQTTARCEFVGAAEGGNNRLADGAVGGGQVFPPGAMRQRRMIWDEWLIEGLSVVEGRSEELRPSKITSVKMGKRRTQQQTI